MDDKERLIKQIETKMKTVMVGSLVVLEEELSELFNLDKTELTEQEAYYREIYNIIRKRIFDNGNNEINKVKELVRHYQIKSNKITLPVVGWKE